MILNNMNTCRKIEKIKLPFLALLFLLALVSCEGDQTVRFKFTNLELDHLSSEQGIPIVIDADSAKGALYGIRMNLFPEETYRKGRYFDAYDSPPYLESDMKSIVITSSHDFDEDHPEGAILNDCFYRFPGTYLLADTLTDTLGFRIFSDDFPDYPDVIFPEYYDLLLLKYPTVHVSRTFFIRMTFSDGTVLSDSTEVIKLF
jgi:hypothetical protein